MQVTPDQRQDFLDAHLEGMHDDVAREGCEECDHSKKYRCDDCYRLNGHDPEVEH